MGALGSHSLGILSIAFPSSHGGLNHAGEVAGRSLYPYLPQVVTDATC